MGGHAVDIPGHALIGPVLQQFAQQHMLPGAMYQDVQPAPAPQQFGQEHFRVCRVLMDGVRLPHDFHSMATPAQLGLQDGDELDIMLGQGGPASFPDAPEVFNTVQGALAYYQVEVRRLRRENWQLGYGQQAQNNEPQAQNDVLQAQNDELQAQNGQLQEGNDQLQAENSQLKGQAAELSDEDAIIAELQGKNDRLQDKNGRLVAEKRRREEVEREAEAGKRRATLRSSPPLNLNADATLVDSDSPVVRRVARRRSAIDTRPQEQRAMRRCREGDAVTRRHSENTPRSSCRRSDEGVSLLGRRVYVIWNGNQKYYGVDRWAPVLR